MKKLLIIDNNTLSRESIVNIIYCIESDSVVYEAESLEHTANINVNFEEEDIIVFNHYYQPRSSFDHLENLKKQFPHAKKILISHSKEQQDFMALIENGAHGVINISSNRNDLIAALRSVKAGNLFMGQSETQQSQSFINDLVQEKKRNRINSETQTQITVSENDVNKSVLCSANNILAYEKGIAREPSSAVNIKRCETHYLKKNFHG